MSNEREWIQQSGQGDEQAWGQLVQVHQQAVFRLAYFLLGDADDAEDIAQETFIHAYRALPSFDPERPMRPWLMRITTHLCSNWRRSLGRYLSALQNWQRNQPTRTTTAQQVEQQMRAEMLWQAVRQLKRTDQQVITLRFFMDCSEAETAEVLGVALGTVKSRQHRALNRLREILQKTYPQWVQEGTDGI